jgi:membrane protease YdiL (CAAX protease family)
MASPVRRYFWLAFSLTWGIGGIGLLIGIWMPGSQPLSTSSPLYYLAGYSVSLTGIALTARYEGTSGLRRLAQRLTPWCSAAWWYVSVVIGYAAITALAWQAATHFKSATGAVINWSLFLSALLPSVARDPGPIGEEFGWRGFALPRLLERYSPVKSTLILGLIHAIWHLPLFFIPGMPQKQLSFPIFTMGVLSIAVFDTALYLRTGASLLLAIIVHLMANVCGGLVVGVLGAQAFPFFASAEGMVAFAIVMAGGLKATGGRESSPPQAASTVHR